MSKAVKVMFYLNLLPELINIIFYMFILFCYVKNL
jgi:hypothetical protein